VITSNTANGCGGGVHIGYGSGSFKMTGGVITNNIATAEGGGVYLYEELNNEKSFFEMLGGVIFNNTAVDGGGVYVAGGSFIMSVNSTVSNNTAYTLGGGVYVSGGCSFKMLGGEISGNFAKFDYGGVYNKGIFNQLGGTVSENKTNGKHPNR
jgi:predicted outer membrane repeat protein